METRVCDTIKIIFGKAFGIRTRNLLQDKSEFLSREILFVLMLTNPHLSHGQVT